MLIRIYWSIRCLIRSFKIKVEPVLFIFQYIIYSTSDFLLTLKISWQIYPIKASLSFNDFLLICAWYYSELLYFASITYQSFKSFNRYSCTTCRELEYYAKLILIEICQSIPPPLNDMIIYLLKFTSI